jgi:fatty acid desaturase
MTRPLPRPRKRNGLRQIFRWPITLALVTIVGLLSALVGDGWADAASWLLLGALVVVMVVALRRGR